MSWLLSLIVNAIRRWSERDDRLLVEQWKSAFQPERKVGPPQLNLRVMRGGKQREKVA